MDSQPDPIETAVARFAAGYTCSQAVLSAFAGQFNLDETTALRLGAPFGGGLGRSGDVCGAVAGALMVLGLAGGFDQADDDTAKEATYRTTQDFLLRFRTEHGDTACRALLGVDLGTAKGLARARESDLFHNRCPAYVRTAAQLAAELSQATGKEVA